MGGRLGEGVVKWSEATQRAAVDLISRQATDATATFLNGDYLTRTLAGIEARADTTIREARAAITYVGSQLRFTEQQQTDVLDHYLGAGQRTAGGVLQAVTSAAQLQDDADVAYEMERVGLRAMTLAAAYQG